MIALSSGISGIADWPIFTCMTLTGGDICHPLIADDSVFAFHSVTVARNH